MRTTFLRRPPITFNAALKTVSLARLPAKVRQYLFALLPDTRQPLVTVEQLCWLANIPLDEIRRSGHAEVFYRFLVSINKSGYIPTDFRDAVLGKTDEELRRIYMTTKGKNE